MSVEQVKNFRKLRAILKELTAFGLNPNQWRLSRIQGHSTAENRFTVYHMLDEEFKMQGSWESSKGCLKVRELEVVGF